MTTALAAEPFSSVDTAWLHMEDPTNLMMVTGVLCFDEVIDFRELTKIVQERFLRFSRFKQRVEEPWMPFATPRWVDDPHFDLHAHLHRVALPPPGDQTALQELVSDLMSTPLDFSKPLWQFHLVEGYGKGCAVLMRLHHAIADGVALVNVLLSMTDGGPPPKPAAAPEPPHGWRRVVNLSADLIQPAIDSLTRTFVEEGDAHGRAETQDEARPGVLSQMLAPAAEVVRETLHSAGETLHEGFDVLVHPDRLLELAGRAVSGVDALAKLLLMPPDPKSVFKGPLGFAKRAAWSAPIPLDDVKAVGRLVGGTVNDVLLTAAAGALRRYLVARDQPVLDLNLRAVVPVNLRPPGSEVPLGNRFGLVFLPLPVGIEDPVDRLEELRQRMDDIKGSPEAVVAFGILSAIGMTPTEVEHVIVNIFGARGTAVMTNVPGPRQTVSLAGRPIRSMMFWVPQSGHLGLGVAILSYAGSVSIGIATDAGLVPDPERIVEGFREEFGQLFALVRKEWEAGKA